MAQDETIDLSRLPWGDRWRIRRVAAGISQKELANSLAMDRSTLSRYENNAGLPGDSDAFDGRHRECVERLRRSHLVLEEVPVEMAERMDRFFEALSRQPPRWRVKRTQAAEDKVDYVVEVSDDNEDPTQAAS